MTQLRVTQEKQNRETEALQKDNHTKIQDYRSKIADLRVEFESIRFRKDNLRGQIVRCGLRYLSITLIFEKV